MDCALASIRLALCPSRLSLACQSSFWERLLRVEFEKIFNRFAHAGAALALAQCKVGVEHGVDEEIAEDK